MADKMSKLVLPVKDGNTITNKEFDVVGSENTFVGTTAEWEALTTEQKNVYDCRVLTDDDLDTKSVIDNLTSDSSTDALSAKQGKVLKGLVDKSQGQVSNSDDAYDPTRPYKVGELCIHDDKLYRCLTPCSAGSWEVNQSCFAQDTLTHACRLTAKLYYSIRPGTSGWQLGNYIAELINGHEVYLTFDISNSTGLENGERLTIDTFIPREIAPNINTVFSCESCSIINSYINGICAGFFQSNGTFVVDNYTGNIVRHIWVTVKYELS